MSYLTIPSLGNKLGHTLMHENWQAIVQADATLLSYMRWTPDKRDTQAPACFKICQRS